MAKLHKNVYSVHLSSLSILYRLCICNASDSLTVCTLIPFPVIMSHMYFRFWLSLLLTFYVNSLDLNLIVFIFHLGCITMVLKMVFCFGNNRHLFFVLNFSVFNLSPIFVLWVWQWRVWHSSPLLLMALDLTSFVHYSS